MNRKALSYLTLAVMFVLVLIPSLHVPMLSDDYYYYSFVIADPLSQFQHYMEWSGRIVTNVLSSYMMTYFSHTVYESLTASAFVMMLFFISCLPSAFRDGKISCSWITLSIIFIFYWIANPTLGQTSFWFVGAANYLWPSFFVSLCLLSMAMTKEKLKAWKIPLALIAGFLAGCSNENTCIVVILITFSYATYSKRISVLWPYMAGMIAGAAVLLMSPGAAARSAYFTSWHSMSTIGKIDLQLFTRMPESMQGFWQVYLLIIILCLAAAMFGSKARSHIVCASVFFVGAILCNLAFVASPFMPNRAYSGALFMMLISASFLMSALLEAEYRKGIGFVVSLIYVFSLSYFIPSYAFFTTAVVRTWGQEQIRHQMILDQVKEGKKTVVIPDYYFTRLEKETDQYPTYKQPKMAMYYGVDEIKELPVKFDYSSLAAAKHVDTNVELAPGVILKAIYLYREPFGGPKKIIYRTSGDINEKFREGAAMFSHVIIKGRDGFINKDTANEAIKIGNDWYTYSDADDVRFEDVSEISIGMYQISPLKTLSQNVVKF